MSLPTNTLCRLLEFVELLESSVFFITTWRLVRLLRNISDNAQLDWSECGIKFRATILVPSLPIQVSLPIPLQNCPVDIPTPLAPQCSSSDNNFLSDDVGDLDIVVEHKVYNYISIQLLDQGRRTLVEPKRRRSWRTVQEPSNRLQSRYKSSERFSRIDGLAPWYWEPMQNRVAEPTRTITTATIRMSNVQCVGRIVPRLQVKLNTLFLDRPLNELVY